MSDEVVKAAKECKVVGNKILVMVDKRVEQVGAIIVPKTATVREVNGMIVSIGDKVDLKLYRIKVGDRIKVTRFAGVEVKFEGSNREFSILHPDDVLVIMKKEEEKV